MTDLNERLAAILEDEPPAPYDLDRVVANGRRALRRRTTLTALAGTAGTAAVTAAVVVPITVANHHGTATVIEVGAQPTASKLAQAHCELYLQKSATAAAKKHELAALRKKAAHSRADGTTITTHPLRHHVTEVQICPPGANPDPNAHPTTPPDPTASMPRYHYAADPQAIASGFASELDRQVKKLGFTVVYSRPFAQESSKLEKGHPSYYDGNVDVQLPDGPADIGVQVTHEVTQLVPFDGDCNAPACTRSTLPDGSLMQVSHIDAGSGGAEVVAVEIHQADGLVVQSQMSNYAFGPEATKDRTKDQPLTIDQLTELAQDPAWTF
ncbi:MAG TPA: hypothetical protein VHE57_01565 [Mycobacteriales bacterium]|nr:hypothetical protein [Mycobacteriales bacterium]